MSVLPGRKRMRDAGHVPRVAARMRHLYRLRRGGGLSPRRGSAAKIKKGPDEINLKLVRNPDIVATVAAGRERPFTGLRRRDERTAETRQEKMLRKGLDMIVATMYRTNPSALTADNNEATVLLGGRRAGVGALRQGRAMARQIIQLIAQRIASGSTSVAPPIMREQTRPRSRTVPPACRRN